MSTLSALTPKRLLNGSVVWRKNHGSNVADFATAVAVTPNGDVIVVGERVAIGESNFKALLNAIVLKLSPNGGIIWYHRYNRGSFYYPFKSLLPVPLSFYLEYTCYASAVTVTPKGDVVVVGYSGCRKECS